MSEGRALPPEGLARSLMLLGELRRIDAALGALGIEHLVLKGLPLAVRLTSRIDGRARIIRDNDILVRKHDARRAVEAMVSLGYEPPRFLALEASLDVSFEYELFAEVSGSTAVVEVHWAPFPPVLYPVDEDWLWRRTEVVQVHDRSFRVLDRPLTILQLASHFVQHEARAEWVLRDLAAAWNAWSPSLDRGELQSSARRTGLTHVLQFALMAAGDLGLIDAPLPGPRSRRVEALRAILPTRLALASTARHRDLRSLQLLSLAPLPRAARWLRLRALPPRALIAATRGRPPTRWDYVEYGVRPFRALARAFGRGT